MTYKLAAGQPCRIIKSTFPKNVGKCCVTVCHSWHQSGLPAWECTPLTLVTSAHPLTGRIEDTFQNGRIPEDWLEPLAEPQEIAAAREELTA